LDPVQLSGGGQPGASLPPACSYYSDDYAEYLGYYEEAGFSSTDAEEVLAFCLDNFEERDTD
jgi:hypothetical protein